jgi:hypothetical protein
VAANFQSGGQNNHSQAEHGLILNAGAYFICELKRIQRRENKKPASRVGCGLFA